MGEIEGTRKRGGGQRQERQRWRRAREPRKARGRREKEETPGFSNTHELLIIDLE